MKNSAALVVFLYALLSLSACKKDDADDKENTPPPRPMIKTEASDYWWSSSGPGSSATTFKYDSQWRVIDENGVKYEYGPNQVVNFNTYGYQLNADGLVEHYNSPGTPGFYYTYDDNGYLATTSIGAPQTSVTYMEYNADSNKVREHHSFTGKTGIITSTYLSNHNTIGNFNYGKYFLGKSSKKLVARDDYWRVNAPGDTALLSYTNYAYTFDSQNRIQTCRFSSVQANGDTTSRVTSTYTYY